MSTKVTFRITRSDTATRPQSAHVYSDVFEPGIIFLEVEGAPFTTDSSLNNGTITIALDREHARQLGLPLIPDALQNTSSPEPTPETIHFAIISHEFGDAYFAARTPAGLDRKLADWIRDYWHEIAQNLQTPLDPATLDDRTLIDTYFEHRDDEQLHIGDDKLLD